MPTARTTKGTRKDFLIVIMILVWSLALPFALAQNDPGHDTLYIEEQGDSELNGSLNITGNVSIEGGRQALINYLDIYFNGETVASPSVPTIAGTANDLYLDAKAGGNVLINAMASSGTVFLGSTGDTVNLNITGALYFVNDRLGVGTGGSQASGNLYWGDKLVCNASESNCGWANTSTGGGDITAVNTNDDWLNGGAESGDVSLTFNESKLNDTIDSKIGASTTGGNLSAQGATASYIPQFQNGSIVNNSIISQSGNTLTIAGNISMPENFYIGGYAKSNASGTTSIGYYAYATHDYATAVGRFANALGGQAVAMGDTSNASNTGAIAIGSNAKASNQYSTVLGYNSRATEYGAVVVGPWANSTGSYAVATGEESNAAASAAIAIGYQAQATAQYATAIGYGVVNDITNSTKLGGMVILSGELNATSHNVSSVSCIVFDSGGKICTGG